MSIEKSLKNTIERYNPKTLSLRALLNDFNILISWYSKIEEGKLSRNTEREFFAFADKLFEEIINRKVNFALTKEASDLAYKVLPRITKKLFNVTKEQLKAVLDGASILVLGSKIEIANPYFLKEGQNGYGFVCFSDGYEITKEEFEKLQSKHKLTDEVKEILLSNSDTLYAYDILWFLPLNKADKEAFETFAMSNDSYGVFLGTGPSKLIPRDGRTNPELDRAAKKPNSKSRRRNSSFYIYYNGLGYLLDATPMIEEQLETFNVKRVDFVLFTHAHRDASSGVKKIIEKFPSCKFFGEKETLEKIQERENISFPENILKVKVPVKIGDLRITPLRVTHSIQEGFPTVCYLIDFPNKKSLLYAEDFEGMPSETLKAVKGVDIAILDAAMWFDTHIKGHQNVASAIEYGSAIKPKICILTQAGYTYPPHEKAQEAIDKFVKDKSIGFPVILAYDGMNIKLDSIEVLESIEDFFNAHALILEELKRRGLKHPELDSLDEITLEECISSEIQKFFDYNKDVVLIPQFISVVGSSVKKDRYEDIDLVVRTGKPEDFKRWLTSSISLQLRNVAREVGLKKPLHFLESPISPHGSNIPLFDLVLRKRPSLKIETYGALELDFKPAKTMGGYGELAFSVDNLEDAWNLWGQGLIRQNIPIVVEEKFDGFRVIVFKEGAKVKITSEDTDSPLNQFIPEIVNEIKNLKVGSCVLDGELLLYADEALSAEKAKLNYDYKKGEKIERIDMKSFLKEQPAGKFKAEFCAFDIVFFNGDELFDAPYIDRRQVLERLLSPKGIVRHNQALIVKSKENFEKAIKLAASQQNSEGAMLKAANFIYPRKTGRTSSIAKVKNYKELVVKITDKTKTKAGAFIYTCALSDGQIIGKTYATKLDLNVGDLLEVRVAEVKYLEGKFTWDNPIVHSQKPKGTQVTTPEQALALSRARREKLEVEFFLHKPINFPGGKSQFLKIFLRKIPKHRIYIEPYLGSGSLFWAKDPAEKSILSDTNKTIYRFFKFLKEAKDSDFEWLRKQNWTYSPTRFEQLKKYNPRSGKELAYKVRYLTLFSNRGDMKNISRADTIEKRNATVFLANLEKYREHLKNAIILNEDALKVVKRYDSEDAFIYLDPPWKPVVREKEWLDFDEKEFERVVSTLKGKVLISYQGNLNLKNFKSYTFTESQRGYSTKTAQKLYWNYSTTESHKIKGEEVDTRSEKAEKFWENNWFQFYPTIQKPEFILHQHFRGLLETEIGSYMVDISPVGDDAILWVNDKELASYLLSEKNRQEISLNGMVIEELMDQKQLLDTSHSIHGDLRFQSTNSSLFGFTIFYGTTAEVKKAGGDRLISLSGDDSLQCSPKLSQPIAWLYLARDKPYISEPREVGSTANKFAKFFAVDFGKYEPGTWHRHFFEFFLDGKKLKGKLIITSAPIEGKRVWLCKRPKDQAYYSETNDLNQVIADLKERKHKYLIWKEPKKPAKFLKFKTSNG